MNYAITEYKITGHLIPLHERVQGEAKTDGNFIYRIGIMRAYLIEQNLKSLPCTSLSSMSPL